MLDKILFMAWHDMPDNFSNGSSVNGLGDLFQYVDFVTGHFLGGVLLIAIASIAFFSMKSAGHPSSKVFSSVFYVLTLLSTMLMIMGLVAFYIPMILAVITIIMAAILRDEANRGL